MYTHNFQDDKGRSKHDGVIMQQIVWKFCLFSNVKSIYWWHCVLSRNNHCTQMHLKHVKSLMERSVCCLVNSCHGKTCLNIFVTHHLCNVMDVYSGGFVHSDFSHQKGFFCVCVQKWLNELKLVFVHCQAVLYSKIKFNWIYISLLKTLLDMQSLKSNSSNKNFE